MAGEKEIFDLAIRRAKHFCSLYDLVHYNRKMTLSQDAENSLKQYFQLDDADSLIQIRSADEKGQRSLLLIHNPSKGWTLENFEDEYASELLRSAVVSAVAALDKYVHLIVVNKCFKLLGGNKRHIPKRLQKLEVPAIVAFEMVEKLREKSGARAGDKLKKAIQDKLHGHTMQGSNQIDYAVNLMGVENFWSDVACRMNGSLNAGDVQKELNKVVTRRNQITHEADFIRQIRNRDTNLFRRMRKSDAKNAVKFVDDFVAAADCTFNS